MRHTMRLMWHRFAAVVLGVSAGVVLSLALLLAYSALAPRRASLTPADYELVRRRLDYDPKAIFRFDPVVSYAFKPRFVGQRYFYEPRPGDERLVHQTNSLGLLGTEEVAPGLPGNVLFLGDSIAYGMGVGYDQIFTSLIAAESRGRAQVFNAAVPGWSTWQELAHFTSALRHVSWARVVVVFCINDLLQYEWVYDDETAVRMSPETSAHGGMDELTRTLESLGIYNQAWAFYRDQRTSPLARLNNSALYAWQEGAWDRYTRESLSLLDPLRGVEFVFVAVPTLSQLEALSRGAPEDVALFPQRKLRDFCAAKGIRFIDVAGRLAGASLQDGTYLDDFHLGVKGHRIVADALQRELFAAGPGALTP